MEKGIYDKTQTNQIQFFESICEKKQFTLKQHPNIGVKNKYIIWLALSLYIYIQIKV